MWSVLASWCGRVPGQPSAHFSREQAELARQSDHDDASEEDEEKQTTDDMDMMIVLRAFRLCFLSSCAAQE